MSIFGIAKKGFGLLGKKLKKTKEKVENMSDKTAAHLGVGATAGAVVAAVPLAEYKHRRKKKDEKQMSPGERKARTGSSTKKLMNKKGK